MPVLIVIILIAREKLAPPFAHHSPGLSNLISATGVGWRHLRQVTPACYDAVSIDAVLRARKSAALPGLGGLPDAACPLTRCFRLFRAAVLRRRYLIALLRLLMVLPGLTSQVAKASGGALAAGC